jgi:amino acid adenylation domain-containing protein
MTLPFEGYRLSPQQRRVWRLQQAESRWRYEARAVIKIQDNLDVERLQAALQKVIAGNEILRSVFVTVPGLGVPLQAVQREAEALWQTEDVYGMRKQEKQARLWELQEEAAGRQWNWTQGPLLAVQVARVEQQQYQVWIQAPALCVDESGMRKLIQAWEASYSGRAAEQGNEEGVQYAAVAEWLNENLEEESSEAGRQFWRQQERVKGGEENLLWMEKGKRKQEKAEGSGMRGWVKIEMGEQLRRELGTRAREQGGSVVAWVEACWRVLQWRRSGEDRVVSGLVCDGRSAEELQGVIGVLARHVPVSVPISGSMKFSELLRAVEQAQGEGRDWQEYYGGPESGVGEQWLDMCVEEGGKRERAGKWEIERVEAEIDRYEWKLVCREEAEGVEVELHYNRGGEGEAEGVRLAEGLAAVVSSAWEQVEAEVKELEVVGKGERRRLIEEFNAGSVEWTGGGEKLLHHWIEEQVESGSERTAVVFEQERISYGELNRRANQLAHYLRGQGVGPEVLVGVFLERSVEMVVTLLGILKAGGAYLPMDPDYPRERLSYMAQDSKIPLLITRQSLSSKLPELQISVLVLEEIEKVLESQSTTNLGDIVTIDIPAYVIYTSGSTGQPKGVIVSHRNVSRLFQSTSGQFRFEADDIWTLFHSFAFDFSVWEIFGALLHGGRLVVVPFWITRSPEQFYQLLIEQKVTVLNQTPSAFQQLVQNRDFSWSSLKIRCVVFGGEALDQTTLKNFWHDQALQHIQLINMYGITETTVHATYHRVSHNDEERGRSLIGRPISDLSVYILDANQKLVPAGMPGEVYIGGDGLARGYLARPDLTAERFVPDPFSHRAGKRLYKSGDIARWLPDGTLDYMGRSDHQVKVRGFRVELGEIEAVLARHQAVEQCVVVLASKNQRDHYLAAYLKVRDHDLNIEDAREFARHQLPEYMVPTSWVILEKMPVLPNGKLNRKALPDPATAQANSSRKTVLPQNDLERTIVSVWQEVLGRQNVGTQDNFFDLGGHSLKAVEIHKRLQNLGLSVNILDLFTHPTIGALAAFLGGQKQESFLPIAKEQASDRKRRAQNHREAQERAQRQTLVEK